MANKGELHAVSVCALDCATGRDTPRCYTQAKIIDMIFFQEGYKQTEKYGADTSSGVPNTLPDCL